MSNQADIKQIGENIVANWLSEKGYLTNFHPILPGLTNIEAQGWGGTLLVQVQSAAHPVTPSSLSENEELKIRTYAALYGYVPWEAKVQINDNLQAVGKIKWRKLI